MKITTTAPAKLILLGEHSVVYGQPALATALDLKTTVQIITENFCEISNIPVISVDLLSFEIKNIRINYYEDQFYYEESVKKFSNSVQNSIKAITLLLNKLKLDNHPVHKMGLKLIVSSDIPVGCGLGSSAAFSVAVSSALMRLVGNFKNSVFELANELEKMFHENPSGIDVYVSYHGGLVEFKKTEHGFCHHNGDTTNFRPTSTCPTPSPHAVLNGSSMTINTQIQNAQTSNPEDSKTFAKSQCKKYVAKQIDVKNITNLIKIEIVNTNINRSSKSIVNKVRKLYNENPEFVNFTCQAITALLNQFKEQLKNSQSRSPSMTNLSKILEKNHHLLNSLGCGHPSIDKIFYLAKNKYHTVMKITGAGGGGCLFSIENLNEDLRSELNQLGFSTFTTSILASGLSIEQKL